MAHEYNTLPPYAEVIEKYDDFQGFFTYQFEELEYRQPEYENGAIYDLKIFWINKDNGLGYGIAQDWKNKKIINYKFGSQQSWREFIDFFASQQY